jgi:hypothetical protein
MKIWQNKKICSSAATICFITVCAFYAALGFSRDAELQEREEENDELYYFLPQFFVILRCNTLATWSD